MILGSVILVEFLPYYLQLKQEHMGVNQEVKATVTKLERNIFGNAKAAHRKDEQSCTMVFQYQFEHKSFEQSYRSSCDKFSNLRLGSSIDILIDNSTPQKSFPVGMIDNYDYLRSMTVVGGVLFLSGLLLLCLKFTRKN